jgi:hypothetical protein
MSAGTAREAGGVVLAVTVDYLFAYAVEPPGATQSGPAVNPYSSATSVPGGGAVCGRTSGT